MLRGSGGLEGCKEVLKVAIGQRSKGYKGMRRGMGGHRVHKGMNVLPIPAPKGLVEGGQPVRYPASPFSLPVHGLPSPLPQNLVLLGRVNFPPALLGPF